MNLTMWIEQRCAEKLQKKEKKEEVKLKNSIEKKKN